MGKEERRLFVCLFHLYRVFNEKILLKKARMLSYTQRNTVHSGMPDHLFKDTAIIGYDSS